MNLSTNLELIGLSKMEVEVTLEWQIISITLEVFTAMLAHIAIIGIHSSKLFFLLISSIFLLALNLHLINLLYLLG